MRFVRVIDCPKENGGGGVGQFISISLGFLLLFSAALPSGALFGVPFKHAAYVATLVMITLAWWRGEMAINSGLLVVLFLFCCYISFYVLIGSFQAVTPFPYVVKEASGMFTAVTVVLLAIVATDSGKVSYTTIVSYSFYGALIFATWKVLVVLGLVLRVLSFDQVYDFILNQAGYRIVSSGIFGGLVRINLIIYDYLVVFFLIFMVVAPRCFSSISKVSKISFFFVGLACVVFAFSRLLFGLLFIGWFFSFVYNLKFRGKLIAIFAVLLVLVLSAEWLAGAFDQRFRSSGSAVSDDIRVEQIAALLDEWSDSPLIGKGFGAYSKNVIRDPSVPYSYEVQWVGFLAKLGSVGVLFLVFLLGYIYWIVLKSERFKEHYILLLTLSMFVIGGFTNQYLVSSASGVIYCLHIVCAEMIRQRRFV